MGWTLSQATLAPAGGTTNAITTNVAVAAGEWIIGACAFSGTGTVIPTAVADNGPGLTWNFAESGSVTATRCVLVWAYAPTGMASGTTITVTFANSPTQLSFQASAFSGGGSGAAVGSAVGLSKSTAGGVWVAEAVGVNKTNTLVVSAVEITGSSISQASTSPSLEAWENIRATARTIALSYQLDGTSGQNSGTVGGVPANIGTVTMAFEASDSANLPPAAKTYRVALGNDGNFGALATADVGAANRVDGWTVAKIAAANMSHFRPGTKQTSGTFSTTALPPAVLGTGASANAFKIPVALDGTFANTAWTFTFAIRATVVSAQRGRIRLRAFRGTNADGSDATEITGGIVTGTTTAVLSTTADTTSVISWSPGNLTMDNQYLFFALAWEITTASGSNSSDVVIRTGQSAAGSRLVTPVFTPTPTSVNTPIALAATMALTPTLDRSLKFQKAISAVASISAVMDQVKVIPATLPVPNDLDYWNAGEPTLYLAGKTSTEKLDYWNSSEVFPEIVGQVAFVPTTTPLTIAASLVLAPAITQGKRFYRSAAATAAITPGISSVASRFRTLAATSVITPALTRRADRLRTLAVTSTLTPALVKKRDAFRSFSATTTLVPTMAANKSAPRTLPATTTLVPVLSRLARFFRAPAATTVLTPTMSRQVFGSRTFTAALSMAPVLARKLSANRTVAATTTLIPTLTRAGQNFPRLFTATTTLIPALSRVAKFVRSPAATTTLVPAMTRRVFGARTFAASLTLTPAFVKRLSANRAVAVTMTVVPTMNRYVQGARTFAATTSLVPVLSRNFKLLKTAAANVVLTPGMTKMQPGGEFVPDQISGLSVWLDASQLGLADGVDVSSWPNLGSGPTPTVSGTPVMKMKAGAAPSGLPAVRFTQHQGRLRSAWGGSDVHKYTLLYIVRRWGPGVGRAFSVMYPPSNVLVGFHSTGQNLAYNNGSFIYGPDTAFPATPPDPWKMYEADSEVGTDFRFFIDGTQISVPQGGTGGMTNGWGISGFEMASTNESMDCDVAEIVIYDRKLSDVERQLVEDYLREKWLTVTAVNTPLQLDVISTLTPALARAQKYARAVAATPVLTPALARLLKSNRTLPATTTVTPVLTKRLFLSKTISVTVPFTATQSRLTGPQRLMSAGLNLAPVLSRRLSAYRTFAASGVLTPALTRRMAAGRLLAASTAILPALSRIAKRYRTLSASLVTTSTISLLSGKGKILSVSVSFAVTMKKLVGKNMAASLNFIPKIQRRSTTKMAVTVTLTPDVQRQSRFLRRFDSVAILQVGLQRGLGRRISISVPVPFTVNMIPGRVNRIILGANVIFTALLDWLRFRARKTEDVLFSTKLSDAELLGVQSTNVPADLDAVTEEEISQLLSANGEKSELTSAGEDAANLRSVT